MWTSVVLAGVACFGTFGAFGLAGVACFGTFGAFGLDRAHDGDAVDHVSGGHFDPAVTVGVAMGKRFSGQDGPADVVTQVVVAIVAALFLWVITVER